MADHHPAGGDGAGLVVGDHRAGEHLAGGDGAGVVTGSSRTERFRAARRDPGLAVLEGFHVLKHALRFGAQLVELAALDPDRLADLAEVLAPDIARRLRDEPPATVSPEEFRTLSPHPPPATGVIALAVRPRIAIAELLARPDPAPLVLLDRPRHLGNVGAVIRVAAAAGAAGVLTTGEHDPWHPAALRGAAGLHYALPVTRVDAVPATDRPVVAVDPEGEPLRSGLLPPRAILAFGSERRGLEKDVRESATLRIGIPMRPGVSSLNLATAVAVVLYGH